MKILAIAIVAMVFAGCGLAHGQKLEVFGGFSSEHIAPCGSDTSYAEGASCGLEQGELESSTGYFNGWETAVTLGREVPVRLHPFLGFTADFSGHYGAFDSLASRYSFLFGPMFAMQVSKFRPFAHALFGVNKETSPSGFDYSFIKPAIALGGGLDVNIVRHFSARLAQIDYEWQKNPTTGLPGPSGFRLATGVVFKF
jgi:hypothetical protein